MSFEEILDQQRPLGRVGDVRFRLEPQLLIAEGAVGTGWAPPLSFAVACALAAGAVAVLAWPGPTLLAVALGLGAAGGLWASAALGYRTASRRRFVLNFATELLRLEGVRGWAALPATAQVPFDAVRALEVVTRFGRRSLQVLYEGPRGPQRRTLIAGVRQAQAAQLERARRVLAAAFGLRGAALEGGPDGPQ